MGLRLGHGGARHHELHVVPGGLAGTVVLGRVPAPLVEVEPADVEPLAVEGGELLVVGRREHQRHAEEPERAEHVRDRHHRVGVVGLAWHGPSLGDPGSVPARPLGRQ